MSPCINTVNFGQLPLHLVHVRRCCYKEKKEEDVTGITTRGPLRTPHQPSQGGGDVFMTALICIESHRIPANASTNHALEQRDLIPL